MAWIPRKATTFVHTCELPGLGVFIQNGMDWSCGCGKVWRAAATQMMPLYGPTGVVAQLVVPTWEEVKPIPLPFTTTAAADAFLDGQ